MTKIKEWFKDSKNQNIIAAVVIIIALLVIFFQDSIWDWWQAFRLQSDKRPVIAQIESLSKNVRFRVPDSLTYYRARTSQSLRAKDTVSTDDGSSAVIVFKSGLKIELEPNSLIVVEEVGANSTLEMTFLKGGVRVLDQGSGPKLALPSQTVSAAAAAAAKLDFNQLFNNQEGVALEEKEEKVKKKPKHSGKETLPESYIASVIRNQKNFLYRCYAQHLRLNPDARGRIDASFTIEPDGSISACRVIASTIPDPTLQQCVVSTLARVRFKSFDGDPMIITYPIHFD